MKLYTELDIYQAISDARYYQEQIMPSKKIVQRLTPIELPSDEEILEKTSNLPIDATPYKFGLKYGFRDGAYWMKEQILNQNK